MSALGVDMAFGPFQMDDGASVNSSCEFKAQIFDEIEIELSPVYYSGEKFEKFAENNAADHPYIPPANLKGKE